MTSAEKMNEPLLCENDERFSGKIKVTTIAAQHEGRDGIKVAVEDNGPGVPAELRERVLEAFFTTKPVGKGTGLGLSLCAAIADSHGGTLAVDDSPELGGARFELWLPLESPIGKDDDSADSDASVASGSGHQRQAG